MCLHPTYAQDLCRSNAAKIGSFAGSVHHAKSFTACIHGTAKLPWVWYNVKLEFVSGCSKTL